MVYFIMAQEFWRWRATFGRTVHDPLVRACWNNPGFAGQCPRCGGWIHFTIRGKHAVDESEAGALPQCPANWADEAIIL